MTNSIDSLVDGAISRLNERRAGTSEKNAGTPPQAFGPSTDLLDLTGEARTLKALEQDLAKTPEFDAARVAELKEAIAGGAYKVDAQSIAGKLLELEGKLP